MACINGVQFLFRKYIFNVLSSSTTRLEPESSPLFGFVSIREDSKTKEPVIEVMSLQGKTTFFYLEMVFWFWLVIINRIRHSFAPPCPFFSFSYGCKSYSECLCHWFRLGFSAGVNLCLSSFFLAGYLAVFEFYFSYRRCHIGNFSLICNRIIFLKKLLEFSFTILKQSTVHYLLTWTPRVHWSGKSDATYYLLYGYTCNKQHNLPNYLLYSCTCNWHNFLSFNLYGVWQIQTFDFMVEHKYLL